MLAFKGYAAVLIWIQLWPPLYAILNYMASIYAAYDLAAAADLGTGGKSLALQTASTIYSRAISGEAVVGYLAISIPFIAWAALKRMENFGTALVGGLSGLQGMISGGTSAATVGNVSMGNVGMDQMQLAPNRTSAFMGSWQNDLSGNTFSSNALTGRTAVSLLRNQGFASRMVSMRVSEQDVAQASKQVDAAQNESVAANTERSAILSEAFSRGLSKLRSSRSSSGSTSSSFEQMGETLNEMNQITKSVAENTGLSQAQVARIAFGAAGHVGVNAGFAGGQLRASAEKSYLSSLSSQEQKALASMSGEQLVAFKQFGDRLSRDSSFLNALSSDSRDAHEISSRLGSTVARSERAEASLAERTSFAERVSSAYEKGESISIDIAQDPHNLEMFMRYAEEYGGDSAAAHTLMESELARQSLRPNRVFSDGTALPASFGKIRDQHIQEQGKTALTPDIIGQHQSNQDRISRFGNAAPSRERAPASSPIREDVHARGNQIRSDAASRGADFDAKAEIIKTDDGTLASKKSLLVQSGKQVGRDTGATFDNAKEVVNDLLKKP